MLAKKPVGRGASAFKYDLLTAMGAYALSLGQAQQRLVLRFMTLLTARYNWQRDELAVGQREIARMWCVNERTVKREIAKLRGWGWLVTKRQGARGRVSEYGLDIEQILLDTQSQWAAVGPDFEHRLSATDETASNIVPMPVTKSAPPPDVEDGSEWSVACALLHRDDPATYTSWIAPLKRIERVGGRLILNAPSRFHATYVMSHLKARALAACRDVDDNIDDLVVIS